MRQAIRWVLGAFETVWFIGIFLLWLSNVIVLIVQAPNPLLGLWAVAEWMSPFNISYYLTLAVLVSPAIGARWLRGKLSRSPRPIGERSETG